MIRIKRLENWILFHPTSPNTDKALELGQKLGSSFDLEHQSRMFLGT